MTDYANEEWLSIKIIDDAEEAELIEGFLKSRDIPCELDSRYSHEFPTHMGRLAEIELRVPESRAQEARRLLESREETGSTGSAASAEAPEADS